MMIFFDMSLSPLSLNTKSVSGFSINGGKQMYAGLLLGGCYLFTVRPFHNSDGRESRQTVQKNLPQLIWQNKRGSRAGHPGTRMSN